MAVKATKRQLSEAELYAPDLDDDGELDPEHYPLPAGDEIEDPYLAEVWEKALKELEEITPAADDSQENTTEEEHS